MVGPPFEDVTEVEVDGRACLYSPRATDVVLLNQTASDVWFLCDGSLTVEQVVDRLATAYTVDAAAIDADVRAAVRSFHDAGLMPPP